MPRHVVGLTLALLLPIVGARADETLQAPGPRERVKVERTQFEVIVWPPKDNVAACRSLTKADFELRLARRPFVDFELDPVDIPPDATPASAPATPSRLVALLFDWWALGQHGGFDRWALEQPGAFDRWGLGQQGAFDRWRLRQQGGVDQWGFGQQDGFMQARAYIEEHPFDRFVIVGLGDDAMFRSTTFQPGPEALATLDRFETEIHDTGFLIKGPHLDTRDWRNAILETVSRLGAMEPRETKDLFVLTTSVFPDSDTFPGELGKLSTENKVRVNTLDLAWDLRLLPFGVFAFTEAGGGVAFTGNATLTSAIETLDRLRPCTFRMTLNVPGNKRGLQLSVTTNDRRFRVTGPEIVGGWFDVVAAENAELKNDYQDPTTEVGVRITPQLVRLSRGEQSAEYALTLLVENSGDFDPEDVGTLRVYGAVWNELKPRTAMYADFSAFRITGDALRKIAGEGGEIFRFPDPVKIPNQQRSVSVIVSVHGPRDSFSQVSASRRIEVSLPE